MMAKLLAALYLEGDLLYEGMADDSEADESLEKAIMKSISEDMIE
jgi:hypothetical protein